jgi:hypothetical protein
MNNEGFSLINIALLSIYSEPEKSSFLAPLSKAPS